MHYYFGKYQYRTIVQKSRYIPPGPLDRYCHFKSLNKSIADLPIPKN